MNWLIVLLLLFCCGNGCNGIGNGNNGNGNNGCSGNRGDRDYRDGVRGARDRDEECRDRNGISPGRTFPWQEYPDFDRRNEQEDCDCDRND